MVWVGRSSMVVLCNFSLIIIAKNGKIKKSKLLKLDNLGKVGYGTCTNNTKVNEIFGLIP